MSLISKLIWYVESRLASPLSLSQVSRAYRVSPFHVTRLFAVTYGRPLMAYVKGRRLSEAARALSGGGEILDVALGAGYGSHEAFTRAFRSEFGLSPKTVRTSGNLAAIRLTEPLSMTKAFEPVALSHQIPRIVEAPALTIAGLSATHEFDNLSSIPSQWQVFRPWFGNIDGQIDGAAYGVCYNYRQTGIDYLAGVEVSDTANLPKELTTLKIKAGKYAVFEHHGHVSGISNTWRHIYDEWLPASGLTVKQEPSFERMDERFDGATGSGLVEIWIPVA